MCNYWGEQMQTIMSQDFDQSRQSLARVYVFNVWTSVSECISFWSIGENFATGSYPVILLLFCTMYKIHRRIRQKKTWIDIDSKPFPLLIVPRDLTFRVKLILGPAPAGAPKNLFLAQVVLETSSFHCPLQHIFLILKCSIFLESDPLGGLGAPKH